MGGEEGKRAEEVWEDISGGDKQKNVIRLAVQLGISLHMSPTETAEMLTKLGAANLDEVAYGHTGSPDGPTLEKAARRLGS